MGKYIVKGSVEITKSNIRQAIYLMEHLYLLVKTNINPKKQRTHMPLFNKLIFENGEVFLKDLEGNLIRTYQRNYFHLKSGIYEVKPEFPEPLIIEINDPITVRSDFQAILNANVKGAVAQADIKGVIAQANAKGAIAHANAKGAKANANIKGAKAFALVPKAKAYANVKGAKAFHYHHFLFKRISSSLVPFWKEMFS